MANLGKVDGVQAHRSSGSLLKPFLYTLSVQDGILLPETQVMDIPTYYGNFSPSNASEDFDGVVTAREALIRSLNVPAVRVLYTYGQYNFYNFLKEAGVTTLFRAADDYGLSLIIGGSEVTLWDMVSVYRGLGLLGNFGNLVTVENNETHPVIPLLDSSSVMLILNCMKDLNRPGAEHYWTLYNNQKPVAWKTGTSYGHKDAWAVAVTPDWTVGVWIGNFDAAGNKNLSGAQSAGPLLFDVINSLPTLSDQGWFEVPEMDFEEVDLCGTTGYLAGEACQNKISSFRPRNSKVLKICPYHVLVQVDVLEEYEVCSYCWEEGHHAKSILYYPPGVLQHIRNKGNIVEKLPQHKLSCSKKGGHRAIEILYPKPGMKIQLTRDFDGKVQEMVFRAAHSHPGQKLFWYLDDAYLGSSVGRHKMSSAADNGTHRLTVIDQMGNKTVCTFESFYRE